MSSTNGSNTPNFNLQHSQVTSGGNTNILNITNNQAPEVNPYYLILERNAVLDALYDSDARYDPPKCHPDTRKAVLNHIRSWALSEDSQPVMWIRGGAGAGKSAIAQTLSEGWARERLLAASFYFFRTASGRNEKKHFIATLAYQMTASVPGCRRLIEDAIRRTPRIFERNLRTQIRELIVDPLIRLSQNAAIGTQLVVIDGLDECCHSYAHQDFEQQQKEILEAIHLASTENGFPLRFLIASRPERQIRETFDHGILESISSHIVLDDAHHPSADIELYLRYSLAEIKRIHSHLGPSWPPEDVIRQLVAKSSGHFIYAAIVVRYLSSPRADPGARLTTIMNIERSDFNFDQPFAELDALYSHILKSVAPQSLSIIMEIFGLMIYVDISGTKLDFFEGITRMSPSFIAKYLFMSPGQLSLHLVDLHSILDIPSNAVSKSAPISFLHASFSEFLTQSSRSRRFFIDKECVSSRILSISIRHVLIQLLSPDNGKKEEYHPNDFASQVGYLLEQINPDNDDLEALQAILSQDEKDFVQYVHKAELGHFGTARRSMVQIQSLYYLQASGSPKRPKVFDTLKRHAVQGFVPINPARVDMWSKRYTRALHWFHSISEETDSAVHPTESTQENENIYNDSQEPENSQPAQRRTKRHLEPESQASSSSPRPKKGQRRR